MKNLNKTIEKIKNDTGQILGYVGEWHTHPMNLKTYSGRDYKTMLKLKNIFDTLPDPIPVFILIVTPSKLHPFVI